VFSEEPRWVDLRFARGAEQLDLRDGRFADAVADVASALRGVAKDELAGEEVRQHRRTVQTAWAAGGLLVVLAVAAVWAGVAASLNAEAEAEARRVAEEQTRVAEEQTQLAEQNAAEALRQRTAAEEARDEAIDEAERADATADRLLDVVLEPADPQNALSVRAPEVVTAPVGPIPRTLPLSTLPSLEAYPSTPRLDFWQEYCSGGACSRWPMAVDESAGLRIRTFNPRRGTDLLADTPFHVRHGFVGLATADASQLLRDGYSVRLYVRLEERADITGFDVGSVYLYEADYVVMADDASCGPTLPAGSERCLQWVFDFDEGFPAGAFVFAVEWTAPCVAWFESDVCESPARPVSLLAIGGSVDFWDEARSERFAVEAVAQRVQWPYDPWEFAEPIPEPSG
jgi:hypothetical protein